MALAIIHGLGSRVRAPETTDLVEGGVVTEKPTTPEDTRQGTPHTIQQTNHSTPLSSALGQRLQARHAVAMQCGVGFLVSTSRTPPHCEGHSAFPVDNRDGDGETMGSSTDSTAQWTWGLPGRSPAMATAYSPRTRIGGECRCEAGMRSNKQQHTLSRGWSAYNT